MRPERTTSIVQEKLVAGALTLKFTCSAGIPWLASCGLYGSKVAETEVTSTGRSPAAAGRAEPWPAFGAGLELHPATDAPSIADIARSGHERIEVRS